MRGADPSLECSPGITALTLGASQGQTESIRILVKEGGVDVDHETSIPGPMTISVGSAKVDVKGQTALICAISSFHDSTAKVFSYITMLSGSEIEVLYTGAFE